MPKERSEQHKDTDCKKEGEGMSGACHVEQCAAVVKVQANIDNLVGWQKSQNGAIHEVNQKVDKLQFWIMGSAVAAVVNLAIGLLMFILPLVMK